MRFELFVALRYLKAKRKQTLVSVISAISVLGVAAGVMALVIALALSTGFREDIQTKIVGATCHVNLLRIDNTPIPAFERLIHKVEKVPHVVGIAPAIFNQVFVMRLRRLGPASFNESPVLALGWSVSAEGRGVVRADQVRKSGTCDEHQVECASLHRTPGIILRSDSLCLRVLAVKADPISPRRHEGSRSVIPSAPVPGRNNHHVWSPGPHACRSAAGMNLGGRRCFVACSNAYAIFMSAGSLHTLPKNEIPIGKPKTKPAGTLMF